MRPGPALVVPPLVFLALLTAVYALVPWACETHRRFPLHLLCALALGVALAAVFYAWKTWQKAGLEPPDDSAEEVVRLRFLAVLALMLSSLTSVAIVALWITQLILAPCIR